MMLAMRRTLALTVGLGLFGCASAPAAPAPVSTPDVTAVTATDLHGYWAEYWAPGGHLRTQRHLFLPDGRWGWACEGGCPAPTHSSGRWTLEGAVIHIESPDGPQQLELEQCPPNEEARAMDAEYRCLAIGGRVFWWQAGPETGAAEAFVAPVAP
jgi:hypothetical protein